MTEYLSIGYMVTGKTLVSNSVQNPSSVFQVGEPIYIGLGFENAILENHTVNIFAYDEVTRDLIQTQTKSFIAGRHTYWSFWVKFDIPAQYAGRSIRFEVGIDGEQRPIYRDVTIEGTAPTPPPADNPALYEIHITAPFNPELPFFVVDKMRTLCAAGGWHINNIARTNDGYIMQTERVGSVSLVVVAGLIAAALALGFVIVTAWRAVRLSDNALEVEKANTASATIDAINKLDISDAEKGELIEKVTEAYQTSGGGNGGGSGIEKNIGLAIAAAVLIAAISSK